MEQSAAAVLAEPYAALFGEDAADAAALVLHHFSGGAPVCDSATLRRVSELVDVVHRHLVTTQQPDADDLARIMAEYGRLWWRLGDACVRSGTLTLGQVLPPVLRAWRGTRLRGCAWPRRDHWRAARWRRDSRKPDFRPGDPMRVAAEHSLKRQNAEKLAAKTPILSGF
jgi:hypothetical protein